MGVLQDVSPITSLRGKYVVCLISSNFPSPPSSSYHHTTDSLKMNKLSLLTIFFAIIAILFATAEARLPKFHCLKLDADACDASHRCEWSEKADRCLPARPARPTVRVDLPEDQFEAEDLQGCITICVKKICYQKCN